MQWVPNKGHPFLAWTHFLTLLLQVFCLVNFHVGRCLIKVIISHMDLHHVLASLALLKLLQHVSSHGSNSTVGSSTLYPCRFLLPLVASSNCESAGVRVSSSQSESSLSEATFFCGGSLRITSSQVGASCSSVMIFLCRASACGFCPCGTFFPQRQEWDSA